MGVTRPVPEPPLDVTPGPSGQPIRRGRPPRSADATASLPDLSLDNVDGTKRPQIKELVYKRLVRAIVDHELPPGTHLKERDLAKRMSVSKTPIREALARMEAAKLVHVTPYRGAVVRTITRKDLREVYELRELLEGFCARRAAGSSSDEDEELMQANIRATHDALGSGDTARAVELLEEFDDVLHRYARGHRVEALLQNLDAQLQLFGRITLAAPGRLQRSLDEHLEILHAVTMQDPNAAEHACRRHVRSVYAALIAQLPDTPNSA